MSRAGRPRAGILVLGVGNVLRGDDGFGVRAAQELQRRLSAKAHDSPQDVKVIVGEMRGLACVAEIERARRVIVLDSLDAGKPPGTLVTFTPDQVRSLDESASPHGIGVLGILKLLSALDGCPPVTLIACQRGNVEGESLSKPVQSAISAALAAVEELMRDEGPSRD